MLNSTIEKISDNFSNEALQSPMLLKDLAAMERYMAESYSGRIFVELLQNADDVSSTKIFLFEKNGHIFFANNGRAFNEEDVIAISRSGASSKKRGEGIGYRGVGFKSTTYLSNEIIIFSNNTYFSFSKKMCSKKLQLAEENIPTVRIPLLIEKIEKDVSETVEALIKEGYKTVFIFQNASIQELEEELKNITVGHYIFLNHIVKCSVNVGEVKKELKIDRRVLNNDTLVTFESENNEQWIVTSQYNMASLAFKYEDNQVIPCKSQDAVYHSYLPTLDRFLYPCKINGDFSTDPSRKHVHADNVTNEVLHNASVVIINLLKELLLGSLPSHYSRLLEVFMAPISYSKLNNSLHSSIKDYLANQQWLLLADGTSVSGADYKCLPEWLENSEKQYIRTASQFVGKQSLKKEIYQNISSVEQYLNNFSKMVYSTKDFVEILQEDKTVTSLPESTTGKILGKIIKNQRTSSLISGEEIDLKNIKVLTNKGILSIEELSQNPQISIDNGIKEELDRTLSKSDVEYFASKEGISSIKQLANKDKHPNKENFSFRVSHSKPIITKWRSAEKQCVELESHFGNRAKDVSKQNVGYDIESTTPNGDKRFIEVKSLNGDNSFTITNNEYTAAHQYGDNYYICLIEHTGNTFFATYIQNPLRDAKFEKRIRQWEWLCTNYSGEKFKFEL